MGFVTAISNNLRRRDGVEFYDFTVAQHSRNYCAKVSDSENGWATVVVNNSNPVFAVVN